MFKAVSSLTIIAVTGGFAVSATAQDAGTLYVQGGASVVQVEEENFGALNVTAGYNFNRYVAVEGEAAFGVQDKTIEGLKAKVDYTLGAYVVGSLPVSENFDLIGRIGAVKGQLKAEIGDLGDVFEGGEGNISAAIDDTALAYGLGVRYFPTGSVHGVRADVTKYDFDMADVKTFQVSYVRRF